MKNHRISNAFRFLLLWYLSAMTNSIELNEESQKEKDTSIYSTQKKMDNAEKSGLIDLRSHDIDKSLVDDNSKSAHSTIVNYQEVRQIKVYLKKNRSVSAKIKHVHQSAVPDANNHRDSPRELWAHTYKSDIKNEGRRPANNSIWGSKWEPGSDDTWSAAKPNRKWEYFENGQWGWRRKHNFHKKVKRLHYYEKKFFHRQRRHNECEKCQHK